MKYHINQKVYDAYAATPKLCVLDTFHFFEFNSKKSEDANFICFASNKAIIEMALKKAEAYGIPLTYAQAKTCLKNCKHSGELVKVLNYATKDSVPLCPLTDNKYIWMTTIRAEMTSEELDALKRKKTRAPFEIRHPEFVGIRDRFMIVLRNRGVFVAGKERRVEAQIDKILKSHNGTPESDLEFMSDYIESLESDEYLYQLENNKFTPRLSCINDISEKLQKFCNFSKDRDRWYDPSKHLKEVFNQ